MAPPRIGLSLPNRAVLFGVPVEDLLKTAEVAEESGFFESVWVGDNYISKPRLEAIVLLSALAARTNRMRLGTVCLASFPFRDPLLLAIQWAALDVLSEGRTDLVVCNGYSARQGPAAAAELKAVGINSSERVRRVEENIAILRSFWSGEPVTFEGRFHSYEDVTVLPKPHQQLPPIGIAANPSEAKDDVVRERIYRRIANLSDGWQCDAISLPDFSRARNRIAELCTEADRRHVLDNVSLHIMVNIDDDASKAKDRAAAFLHRYYGATGGVADQTFADWVAFGSPQQVIDKIGPYIEAGCTTPILRFADEDQLGQLERCAADVLPALSKMESAS
ncbi:LLM class flavin-dependent oxidoreductase [Nocardia sp. NPDC059246]|uniref:LLM class flavin-dependent oxidoreductase n=1 Tax=unclassified Nocardia TaxID=2637762 RepID=UPI0036C025B5